MSGQNTLAQELILTTYQEISEVSEQLEETQKVMGRVVACSNNSVEAIKISVIVASFMTGVAVASIVAVMYISGLQSNNLNETDGAAEEAALIQAYDNFDAYLGK